VRLEEYKEAVDLEAVVREGGTTGAETVFIVHSELCECRELSTSSAER